MATRLVESTVLRLIEAAQRVVHCAAAGQRRKQSIEHLKGALAGISRPVPLKALVVVCGGNAEVYTEPGVQAVVVDLDNLKHQLPGQTVPISVQYADLLAFAETAYPISDSSKARLNDAQEMPPMA